MINLDILFPALITTTVAIFGWYCAHKLSIKRDRENKKRDLTVSYLIEAYRRIERSANRPKTFANDLELESAIADIQLFGTPHQAKLAERFAFEIAENSNAKTDDLLIDLRKELRRELNLEPVAPEITYLRIENKK